MATLRWRYLYRHTQRRDRHLSRTSQQTEPSHTVYQGEIEENGKIPFLDCLVSRDNNKLRTTTYRKPTHTDRLLDQSSYNPTSHKATTIQTLTRRAQLVCDSTDSLPDESNYLNTSSVRTNTMRTLLDETPTNLLNITERTLTRHLSLQRQYLTSRALLRPSRGYYNLTISVLLTNPLRLCDSY